jgi:hypothetical protein
MRPDPRDGSAPPAPIVAYRKLKDGAERFDVDVRDGCMSVLGSVRESFRDDVGRGHLHVGRAATPRVTDDVDLRAWLRIDLADVLSIAERTVEARSTLEEAVRLAEAKEDVVAAERARARLAELQASVPHR